MYTNTLKPALAQGLLRIRRMIAEDRSTNPSGVDVAVDPDGRIGLDTMYREVHSTC